MAGKTCGAVNPDIRDPITREGQPVSRVTQLLAGRLESRGAEGIRSLETRWIFSGRLGSAVASWLGRFPGEAEIREDVYLIDPQLHGISAKVRALTAFEVKVYQGSPGVLEVAGRALGRMEYWQKSSFPWDPVSLKDVGSADWVPVRKRRRVSRFSLAGGKTGCAVELTEMRAREEDWWSLGFEATGQDDLLRGEFEAVVARVLAGPAPNLAEFGLHNSRSYADWLQSLPPSGTVAHPGEATRH